MKFFALLPLATLFMGALSSPTISVALQERESADPLSTLQQFTADSKQYTDVIRMSFAFSYLYFPTGSLMAKIGRAHV